MLFVRKNKIYFFVMKKNDYFCKLKFCKKIGKIIKNGKKH